MVKKIESNIPNKKRTDQMLPTSRKQGYRKEMNEGRG